MAISKNRPQHDAKVRARREVMIQERLDAGLTKSGDYPPSKTKRTPHSNPERQTRKNMARFERMTNKQLRKHVKRLRRENNYV